MSKESRLKRVDYWGCRSECSTTFHLSVVSVLHSLKTTRILSSPIEITEATVLLIVIESFLATPIHLHFTNVSHLVEIRNFKVKLQKIESSLWFYLDCLHLLCSYNLQFHNCCRFDSCFSFMHFLTQDWFDFVQQGFFFRTLLCNTYYTMQTKTNNVFILNCFKL